MASSDPDKKKIEVGIGDDPSLSEVMDRAKLAYLGLLMEECDSHVPSVAKRLNCTDANVRKAVRHLVTKYGSDT